MQKKQFIYPLAFFASLDFTRGLILNFLLSRGIGQEEIGLAQSLLFLAVVLSEIPLSYLSDKRGRRFILILGSMLLFLGFTLVKLSSIEIVVYIAFASMGMGLASFSGTQEAYIYDISKNESLYLQLSSRTRFLSKSALCLGLLGGGYLADQGLIERAIDFSIAAFGMSMLFAALLSDNDRPKDDSTEFSTQDTFSKIKLLIRSKELRLIGLQMILIEASHTPSFMYSQLLLNRRGVDNFQIGVVMIFATAAAGLTSLLAPNFSEQIYIL